MKTGIIIQARMSSRRLCGKSLKEFYGGKPLIHYVVDRCFRVELADTVILATSSEKSDDPLAEWGRKEKNLKVFRGSLDNVCGRFYRAAESEGLGLVIRVTGDNPLISHELIDDLISRWEKEKPDYIGMRNVPLGIGSELFTFDSFAILNKTGLTPFEKEHVTPRYYNYPENWNLMFVDYGLPDMRLTVDTEEDFENMKKIYKKNAISGYVELSKVIKKRINRLN